MVMFCILRKIIRKNLNKRMTLSKDPKRSERMRHEETRITSLVEGTVNAKTCKWKHIWCLFKEQWSGQYDWSREEEWEMRLQKWRMVRVQGRKAKVSSNCHARYIMPLDHTELSDDITHYVLIESLWTVGWK